MITKVNRSNLPKDHCAVCGRDMLTFLLERGWVYFSSCGCHSAMNSYHNKDPRYNKYEIRVNAGCTVFQIHYRLGHNTRLLRGSDAAGFKEMYNRYLT